MIGPEASVFGFAVSSSSASATRSTFSSSSSRPCCSFAETSAYWVVPPHSSGWRPWCTSSCRTRVGFASGRSILFTATTIGTSAARAWLIDSIVCGMTPSSAATTSTAMSVTFAPRARSAVNASWPGVSRNVIAAAVVVDLVRADVLRDAAGLGLDARADSRIASSSVVLPWSTWPMIVTTGGRATRSSGASSKTSGSASSSSACLISTSRSNSAAISSTASSDERLGDGHHLPDVHHDLDDLRHRDAERLRERP